MRVQLKTEASFVPLPDSELKNSDRDVFLKGQLPNVISRASPDAISNVVVKVSVPTLALAV